MADKLPATADAPEVSEVFGQVIDQVRKGIAAAKDPTMVVDVAIDLKQVSVTKGGVPIFSPKTTEQSIEIRLATRVRAAEE